MKIIMSPVPIFKKTNDLVENQKNNIQEEYYFTQRKQGFNTIEKKLNVNETAFFETKDDTKKIKLVKYWDDNCTCSICRNAKRGE